MSLGLRYSLYRGSLYVGFYDTGVFPLPRCSLYRGSLYRDFLVLWFICQHQTKSLVKREKRADFIFLLPFSSGIFGAALGFCHVFLLKTEFSSSMGIIHSLNKVIKYSFIVLNIHTLCFVRNPEG